MAFGQQSGPPATHRQLQELTELLHEAGHVDFRDARGPLGLTQRQAAGKFTRDEADELIEQLRRDAELAAAVGPPSEPDDAPPAPRPRAAKPPAKPTPTTSTTSRSPAPRAVAPAGGAVAAARARREAEALQRLREAPDEALAAELERRGWTVTPP